MIISQKKLISLFCRQYWEPCHRCWIVCTGFLFVWHEENSCYVSNQLSYNLLAPYLIHKAGEVTGLLNFTKAALCMLETLSFLKCILLFFRAGFKDFAPSGYGCGVLACWMIRFDTKFLEAESTNMRLLVFFHKSETNQVKLKFRDTFRYWITAPISRHFTWCNILKHNLLFAYDKTRTNYVVFHSRGFYNVPRMLIAGPGHFRLWPPSWTDWHTWLPSHAGYRPSCFIVNFKSTKLWPCL